MSKADNILFRASSVGKLLTEPRLKSETMAETVKTFLREIYIKQEYGRTKDISNKYIEKGLKVEEDSLTLYSRATGNFFTKNEEHFTNDFLSGTPDILHNGIVIDIKSSYDIFTFFKSLDSKIDRTYYCQLQSYMALTGLQSAKLVYCLTDMPEVMLNDEKRKLMWKMGALGDSDPLFEEAAESLEHFYTYADIPLDKRYFEIDVPRDNDTIQLLYAKVVNARQWMNENLFNK
jgi:hypothetical protein